MLLVRQSRLAGQRPWRVIYLAGFLFWLAALQFLRLPHWATSFGWVALSAYLGLYPLLFVAISRFAVHRLRWPLLVAAPLVWTGLEVIRGYLFGGFTTASLAHSQYRWVLWIQFADIAGAYGVSGVMALASACLASMIPWNGAPARLGPAIPLAFTLGGVLAYGAWRTSGDTTAAGARVALIQGSIDTTFDDEPGKNDRVMREYGLLTLQAVSRASNIDLIVWPESMFRSPLVTFESDYVLPPHVEATKEEITAARAAAPGKFFAKIGVPVLIGLSREHLGGGREQRFNTAQFVAADGALLARYDKMHLVMFGEYVPFFDWFPALYKLTPLGEGLSAGAGPVCQEVAGIRFSPNICYETVVPQVIRRQVNRLSADGQEPDVLVNLTNDGWFWGSSALDFHLICNVFRAVECRKPLLVAANTGFSAWIDGDGRIQEQGPRRERAVVFADVRVDQRTSPYLRLGGWFEALFAVPVLILAALGLRDRRLANRKPPVPISTSSGSSG